MARNPTGYPTFVPYPAHADNPSGDPSLSLSHGIHVLNQPSRLCCSDLSCLPLFQQSGLGMEAAATLPPLLLLILLAATAVPAPSHAWGVDGHLMVCQIAQARVILSHHCTIVTVCESVHSPTPLRPSVLIHTHIHCVRCELLPRAV